MKSKAHPSTYTVKMMIQLKNNNSMLLNTMFHASNIPRGTCKLLSCHNSCAQNSATPMKTIEQHVVHSVWQTIQNTAERNRIAAIPQHLQDTVHHILRQPLLPADRTKALNVPEVELTILPQHIMSDFSQKSEHTSQKSEYASQKSEVHMTVGKAMIHTKTAEINTHLPVVHLKINDTHPNNLALQITAVVVKMPGTDQSDQSNTVHMQHFLCAGEQTPLNLKNVLSNYGKQMQANSLSFDPYCSHKIHRHSFKLTHMLACQNLGFRTDVQITSRSHNALFTTLSSTLSSDTSMPVSCVSVFW